MIDLIDVGRMVEQGYINIQEHPHEDLRILNYSTKAQYDWNWTPTTMACRGLIIDSNNEVVARPFQKFFSYDQLAGEVPSEPFEVFDKLDGSLGIMYPASSSHMIATRGSFVSDQAVRANKILRDKYGGFTPEPGLTYLFEIIYPENRIVVDYGETEDLFLLAAIDIETGADVELPDSPFPVVKRFDGLNDLSAILAYNEDNTEGFVIRFQSGQRVKVKTEQYQRLAKVLAGLSEKSVWEHLRAGTFDSLIDSIPDEHYDWAKGIKQQLESDFKTIVDKSAGQMAIFPSRKETAAYFSTCAYPGIMFSMLDGKEYTDQVWRLVKPKVCRQEH